MNKKLSHNISFKPMVSRTYNEVFKPSCTSKGLIHFDVQRSQIDRKEQSALISDPIK